MPLTLGKTQRSTRDQKGNSLIVVLVVLTLLALAGFGAMRSADTGNVIAGNFAFQQASTQASDSGLQQAMDFLAATPDLNADVANRYSNIRLAAIDARGVPTAINWANVGCTDENGALINDCNVDAGNFRIQYFVERLCSATPAMANINDIRARCEYEPAAGATTPANIAVRYRVIIRVRGPRNSEGWYEAMLSGPAAN